ncbi:MAG TPA: hypothetical protein VKB50_31785 [Vicinamibacterales bacterium]|nr:hypothetical protein [Vicinamibacterales bacterium]
MTVVRVARLVGVVVGVALAATPTVADAQWIELKRPYYSVFHAAGFERDAELTLTWMDRTEALMKAKYGVTPERYRVSVYLHPAPTDKIDVNRALNNCCTRDNRGINVGTIDYLSPSAAAWRAETLVSSLGLPKNDVNYHAKVLVSEYIPIGHLAAQDARPAGGWRYYSAPSWFYQGLQEYDSIFHTTDFNRDQTRQKLFEWARKNAAVFSCCSEGLKIGDVYNGGVTFVAFLAAQFGEEVHARLLMSSAPTFDRALAEVTGPVGLPALFDRFRAWLAASGG